MACLVEFLKCLPSDGRKDKALASLEFKEWQKLRKECDMMLERGYFHGRGRLSDPEILVLKKERRLFDAIWKQYRFIPNQMCESVLGEMVGHAIRYHKINEAHTLDWFADSPRVELSEIREAAAKLSYMVIPVSYMVEKTRTESVFHELWHRIDSISCWISDISEYVKQDLYVLCPVSFYDICRVEKETRQHEVIFGGELMQTRVLLDTITQIQRNLFALLDGDEDYTNIWEIGEGCGCSENELTHLRVLVETIMPIQRSLLKIACESKDMGVWEEEMRKNHYKEISRILQETSQRLSWIEEARSIIEKSYNRAKPWEILETAVTPDVLVFSLRHGTSLIYGNEPARVMIDFGTNMPESFYLNRGFTRQNNEGFHVHQRVSTFKLY